jgi:uncharacterized protein GlcG (DUF336 family)
MPLRFAFALGSALTFLVASLPVLAAESLATKSALNLGVAKQVAAAAEAAARKNNWTVVIAVVDDGGHLVYLQRMDETQYGSVEVATQKAQTAMAFKRPTKALEDAVTGGRTNLLGLPATPVEGGVPLLGADGKIIGAIGVSGVTSEQDGIVAKAGAEALAALVKKP